MFRKNGLRVLSLMVVLCMLVVSFAACSKKEDKPNDTVSKEDSTSKEKDNQKEGTSSESEITELDTFINFTWYTNEEFKGLIPEEITKRTGNCF